MIIPSLTIVGFSGAGGGGGSPTPPPPTSPTISISNQSVTKSGRASQTASYSVNNDGSVTKNAVGTFIENWISTPAQADNYDVMATKSSGTTPSGTLGSWLALSSDRSWSLTNNAQDGSTISCVLTVQIRLRSSGAVKDTATITISATSNEDIGGGTE
jgi:hypothetical protein